MFGKFKHFLLAVSISYVENIYSMNYSCTATTTTKCDFSFCWVFLTLTRSTTTTHTESATVKLFKVSYWRLQWKFTILFFFYFCWVLGVCAAHTFILLNVIFADDHDLFSAHPKLYVVACKRLYFPHLSLSVCVCVYLDLCERQRRVKTFFFWIRQSHFE